MKEIKIFSCLAIFMLLGKTSIAQDLVNQASWMSKHSIEISMGNHAIGLPFNHFLSGPFYPELNIGIQSNLLDKKKFSLNMVNGIGFATHPFNGERYFVNTYLRTKYKFPFKVYCQIGLGLGFNILNYPNSTYGLNNSGIYEEKTRVETEWYSGLNMEIGYHFKCIKRLELDVFSKYSAGVNLFHHPEIPVFPYNSFQLGVRFYMNQNDHK